MDSADSQDKKKRETRRDRIVELITNHFDNDGITITADELADLIIAAYPDPYVAKERNKVKGPNDHCALFALRHELQELHNLIRDYHSDDKVFLLTNTLKEQGVVE